MINTKEKRYSIEDLLGIIEKLRGENGCPWDRAQTHDSIKKCMIEETYEAIDALEAGDDHMFSNELGDLLLQIVFHSQMARERGAFDFDDVVYEICQKMIDRHTHVFGSDRAANEQEALGTWEKNKKKEKKLSTQTEAMRDIPSSLPALMRAEKVQKKAANVGFDWKDIGGALKKVQEEMDELCEAVQNSDGREIEEELGDLIFSTVNVARFTKCDPEEVLRHATDKFIGRFDKIEQFAQQKGKILSDLTSQELKTLWQKAKTQIF